MVIKEKGGIIMGYSGCPCYRDYFLMYGRYCDDKNNNVSCSECPLLELARKKNNG